jgi:hypothetical protein
VGLIEKVIFKQGLQGGEGVSKWMSGAGSFWAVGTAKAEGWRSVSVWKGERRNQSWSDWLGTTGRSVPGAQKMVLSKVYTDTL